MTGKTETKKGEKLKPHEVALAPEVHALVALMSYAKTYAGELEMQPLVEGIYDKIATVKAGDMAPVEAMLISQAESLQAIFTNLSRRAFVNMEANYMGAADTYMRLALKAQTQCRATIEALAEIKNPRPLAFVKQANIAQQQQVNNGLAQGKPETLKNKLLEERHGDSLELGTQGAAGDRHPALETVGTLDRAANA